MTECVDDEQESSMRSSLKRKADEMSFEEGGKKENKNCLKGEEKHCKLLSSSSPFTNKPNVSVSISEVEKLYNMKFPCDFVSLWKFCHLICPSCPRNALLQSLGFTLVGPFDVLSGRDVTDPLLHYRYFLDPPEFQTVISVPGSSDSLHYGYFRDDPNQLPAFVVSATSTSCILRYQADNLLEFIRKQLVSKIEKLSRDENGNSKNSDSSLRTIKDKLEKFAEDAGINLQCCEKSLKARKRKSQGTTFHKLGISVEVTKDDVGYRPIHHDDVTLRKMMNKVAQCKTQSERLSAFGPLHEQITFVQFANDESDFGMGLELGLDFFLFGSDCFHKTVKKLLPTAYKFLKRDLFADIVERHLDNRHKDSSKIVYLK